MRKVILSDQNNGKALELRLEQGGAYYFVVLEGMTINLHTGNIAGVWEGTGPDDYLIHENDTYVCHSFLSYREAKSVYDTLKTEHID